MNRQPTPPKPPLPIEQAEDVYALALQGLLKAAYEVGKQETLNVAKAKEAKRQYQRAVSELRRSERAVGRRGSINWINAQLGSHKHSNPDNRTTAPRDIEKEITVALQALDSATW